MKQVSILHKATGLRFDYIMNASEALEFKHKVNSYSSFSLLSFLDLPLSQVATCNFALNDVKETVEKWGS